MKKMITTVCVLAIAVFVARTYMPQLGDSVATSWQLRHGESRLGDCPSTPNCQSSEASDASQRVDRLIIVDNAGDTMSKVSSMVAEHPGMEVVEQTDRYLHATSTSAIMRYVDDIEFLVSDDRQTLQIRSASRLGKADLGANAKRIEAIRAELQPKL